MIFINYSLLTNYLLITNQQIIDKLTKFLSPIDLLNLKSSSKILYYSIDNNLDVNKQLLTNYAKMKNDIINKINNYDMKQEYEVSDFVMEKLIKE